MLAAGETSSQRQTEALERLCATYWEPLYAFLRRSGYRMHDAQDFTQSFLAHLLSRNLLQRLSPEKGRFRSFLLVSLKHYLADEHDRAAAAKRGGGMIPVRLDTELAECRFAQDVSSQQEAERVFDRRWALVILDRALERLCAEFEPTTRHRQFAELRVYLSTEGTAEAYAKVAERLQMTPGAVPVAVHRMRLRYREAIRAEIAHTVSDPAKVDEEMHYLLELLCQ